MRKMGSLHMFRQLQKCCFWIYWDYWFIPLHGTGARLLSLTVLVLTLMCLARHFLFPH